MEPCQEGEERDERGLESVEREATHILEEARMVLPGVQALFGFQMVAFFTDMFRELSVGHRMTHMAATMLTIAATGLLMAPAAYHRQAEPHRLTANFLRLGTRFLTAGMFVLMLGISTQVFVIAALTFPQLPIDLLCSGTCLLFLLAAWFVLPRVARRRQSARRRRSPRTA